MDQTIDEVKWEYWLDWLRQWIEITKMMLAKSSVGEINTPFMCFEILWGMVNLSTW